MELVCTHKGNDVFSMQPPTPILEFPFLYGLFLFFFFIIIFGIVLINIDYFLVEEVSSCPYFRGLVFKNCRSHFFFDWFHKIPVELKDT